MLRALTRPFSYLQIQHPAKLKVDWIYPAFLSALSVIVILTFRSYAAINIFDKDGLIASILGFVQNLPGFYIAALAAIATFNKVDIDHTMPDPAPTLYIRYQGKSVKIELTRRRFLCSMFAFLTAENIFLVALSILSTTFSQASKALLSTTLHLPISAVFLLIYFVLLWQMIVTTFWGLFYLGDKLHQPD